MMHVVYNVSGPFQTFYSTGLVTFPIGDLWSYSSDVADCHILTHITLIPTTTIPIRAQSHL